VKTISLLSLKRFLAAERERIAWFSTIRGRLYLAFGVAAALTILCSSLSYYEFVAIGTTTNRLVSKRMPAAVVSLRLAEEATSLVSSAPRLMAAQNETARAQIEQHIGQQEKQVADDIDQLKALDLDLSDKIVASRNGLLERLQTLSQAISDKLQITQERAALAASIRTTHEALLDALAPAIDDANFDLMTRSKSADTTSTATLLETVRRLLEINSEANLLAGLLTEASLVNDSNRLKPLRDLIGSAQRKIGNNLSAIVDAEQRKKITELSKELSSIGADDGIVELRRYELTREEDAQKAFDAAQSEAVTLKTLVDTLVAQQVQDAQDISEYATRQLRSGKAILAALSAVAIVGALLVAWLYVGRNVIRRLGVLGHAMRRIADGELNIEIKDDRNDEISSMSRTLLFFRQATADAAFARQKEIDETRRLELRRQLVDAATKGFEEAISNVVQTLHRAAAELDNSANSMSATTSQNQEQALATASASEEATSNVESVAAGADEIARSIEHIAERVTNSATVAGRALENAQAISTDVENLSGAVAEISEFSNLIRSIASQTNLLALNATIEAARAGQSGRGFAVVAQEVKTLAAQTSNATEAITRQISKIEETAARCASGIKTVTETIVQLNAVANDVAASVREQDAVTQEIARNAAAAAQGTRAVASNINEVSTTANKTGQVANTVLVAAAQLSEQSNLLRGEVEHYLSQIRAA